jgi:shikimate kinase
MGSGKTTLGRGVAEALGWEFFDSDQSIVGRTGREGREIALVEGVDELHRLEREVFFEALATGRPSVVAAAASVIDDDAARQALGTTFCVHVTADPETLARRSSLGSHRRTVSGSEHLEHRTELFAQVADLVVDTGVMSEQESIDRILASVQIEESR